MEIKLPDHIKEIALREPIDIYYLMRYIFNQEDRFKLDLQNEHFFSLGLNRGERSVSLELVGLGDEWRVIVIPADVFKLAVYKRARGIVLIHNHPNGVLAPSEADKKTTDIMIQVGRILRIPVLDHLIITNHSYYSFKDTGLLDILSESINNIAPYELEKQLHKEMQKEIRLFKKQAKQKIDASFDKGIKQGREEVARNLLLKFNLDIDTVQKATDLPKYELEKILNNR